MDDLISEFIAETSESLGELDLELVRLEKNPNDTELLGNIFRLVHTIKGTCGFLGLPRLESVAHSAENVLGKVRDKEMVVSPEVVTLILESFDTIKFIMEHLEAEGSEPDGDDAPLIARLDAMVAGGSVPTEETDFTAAVAQISGAELTDLPEDTPAAPAPDTEAPSAALPDSDDSAPAAAEDVMAEPAAALPGPAAQKDAAISGETAHEAIEAGLNADIPRAPAEAAAQKPAAEATAAAIGDAPASTATNTAAAGNTAAGKKTGHSIRVNLDILEELMQMVSELVLTRNQLLQISRTHEESEYRTPLQRLSLITSELQEGVMKTRMQPIGNAWSKFPRLIRDLSVDLNKSIELNMIGEETELDRQLLEMIKDPLTHMVRNSCDHGLEGPEERKAAGKPETGTVTLRAYHEGGHIIIEIADDGRGLNSDKIKAKALSNGLASEEALQQMSENQILQFIFAPGFSTAEKVTNVSGRGVGMDVVRSNIEKIGGAVELHSEMGKGSVFKIKIPLTLAIVSVLIVECAGERFAIPQINVLEMLHATKDGENQIEMINNTPVMRLRNKLLPMISLSEVLHLESSSVLEKIEEGCFVVVCNVGGYDFGVVLDRIYDTEEIVVKPVAPLLQHLDIYSGCTILGDGSVIMILDPNGMARRTGEVRVSEAASATKENSARFSEKQIRFLLFSIPEDTTPKAVPLDVVSRLEELDAGLVEHSSGAHVVQYRGELMRLISLNGKIPDPDPDGMYQIIVFQYDSRHIGLIVEDIVDIVSAQLDVKLPSSSDNLIGSMVLGGRTTDILDVGFILTNALGELVEHTGSDPETRPGRQTVLLVDDSAFFRNLTAPFLSARGMEVIVCETAKEAMGMLDKGLHVDLIISDIEMPEISGVEFAQMCKRQRGMQHMPMIALTSNMKPEAIQRGLEAGFAAYISKTDREGLVREITSLLGTQESLAA